MGRLGQFPVDAPDFIRSLGAFSRLEIAGIYSHLATADNADRSAAERQTAQ